MSLTRFLYEVSVIHFFPDPLHARYRNASDSYMLVYEHTRFVDVLYEFRLIRCTTQFKISYEKLEMYFKKGERGGGLKRVNS